MSYYEKYLFYKKKYLSLKAQRGGAAAAAAPIRDPDIDRCRAEMVADPNYIESLLQNLWVQLKRISDRVEKNNNIATITGYTPFDLSLLVNIYNEQIDKYTKIKKLLELEEQTRLDRLRLQEQTSLELLRLEEQAKKLLKLEEQHPEFKKSLEP
jgi:hypothetical protein